MSFLKPLNFTGMEIFINQQVREVPDQCSLEQLILHILNMPTDGMAVAINYTVVPQPHWQAHSLQPADKVMLIRATAGG